MLGVSLPRLRGRHHAETAIYDGEMTTLAHPGSG
jgi:hypothetical protein